MKLLKSDETMIWATAYSVAAALLTLGETLTKYNSIDEKFADHVDQRAAAIADSATKRLKGKLK